MGPAFIFAPPMQKLIAILFFLLLCSTTLLQGTPLLSNAVEQLADSDKGKEAPSEKKEGKEFLAGCIKKAHLLTSIIAYTGYVNYWPLQPVLRKPTPPPDVIC